MLAKTHKLTEEITTALGPIFHEHPDYTIIQQAMGLVLARVAMATPMLGKEKLELEVIHEYSRQALKELLKLEAEEAAKEALVDKGIDGFAEMFAADPAIGLAAINGGMGAEAQAAAEEAQGRFSGKIAEGGNPGEFGYKVVEGEESPAGRTLKEAQAKESWANSPIHQQIADFEAEQKEAEQAWNDTIKEDQ